MDWNKEFQDKIQEVWTKLQGLPQASPLELGAFFIVILFVGTFIFMMVVCCIHCCCCGKPKYQVSRVKPLHSV